jgi:hypothetical protein
MSLTNKELLQEIKEARNETKEDFESLRRELAELKREFYLFKGKAFGFISVLTTIASFAIEYAKRKLGS